MALLYKRWYEPKCLFGDLMVVVIACFLVVYLWGRVKETSA